MSRYDFCLRARPVTLLASILACVLFVTGCNDSVPFDPVSQKMISPAVDADEDLTDATSSLDLDLWTRLTQHSPSGDPDFFRLPTGHQLDRIPQDPRNPLTPSKVRLGQALYHDTALGIDPLRVEGLESYSCASCHHAQGGFMANLPQGISEGGSGFGTDGEARTLLPDYNCNPDVPDLQPIRTPTTLNSAYQELMLWNGQFGGVGDNLGTEDLWLSGTPLESNWLGLHGVETQAHAGLIVHRMGSIEASRVANLSLYQARFRAAFPGEPVSIDRLHAALAIAAYERTLLSDQAPFQKWLQGNKNAMTDAQKRGAIVFFGKAGCVACHTGPALNSMQFHALGMNDLDGSIDMGRVDLTPFQETVPDAVRRGRGGFTGVAEDDYKFKTPQLYNLKDSPFYGHGASFGTLRDVVQYKNAAVPENPIVPPAQLASGFVPLGLTDAEIDDLVAFLEEALYDADLERYVPNRVPSGNCFPTNDAQSQIDLGCIRSMQPTRTQLVWGDRPRHFSAP
jgi:cytochrome c peroxidase